MEAKNQISEILVGLHEVEIFLKVFNDFARNSTGEERLDYVNGVVSMISMQSVKIGEIIKIANKLEDELRQE